MTVIVKIGGGAGIDPAALCTDLALLYQSGQRLVLVHGTSHAANDLGARLGQPPRFVTSPSGYTSRYTDRTTLEIFMMAAAGLVNTTLVEALQAAGANALGLTGVSGRLLGGTRKATIRIIEDGRPKTLRDDWTGTVDSVNTPLLTTLLDAGYLPVIAPLAVSAQGEALNIDGDRAAAAIAAALGAEVLLLLSNVPGLLASFPDETSLIGHIPRADVEPFLAVAQGRMKKKVLGAAEAVAAGVGRVVIGDARRAQPVRDALAGCGTVIQ